MANHAKARDAKLLAYVLLRRNTVAGLPGGYFLAGSVARTASAKNSMFLLEDLIMKNHVSYFFIAIVGVALAVGAAHAAQATNKGPHIILKYPELGSITSLPTIRTTTSAHFEVVFEPREAAVDMHSLAVWARKGIFKKSLTERLKPYIRGNAIVVEGIELPTGQFVLEIRIADTVGIHTTQKFRVAVH